MYTSCFCIMVILVAHICASTVQLDRIDDPFIRMTLPPGDQILKDPFFKTMIRPCNEGLYGSNCTLECSAGCQGNVCGRLDGTCECRPYFTGEKCNKCISGRFGLLCKDVCPKNCVECDTAILSVPVCSECKDGYYGRQCELKCQPMCASCYSNLSCERCPTGYYGSSCRFMCGVGCQNNSCEQKTGRCTCNEHYTGLTCNTCVPGGYGINCLHICSTRCHTCNSADHCLTCKSGFYGSMCNNVCSVGCSKGVCDINGACLCRTNFTGEKCDDCQEGAICDHSCPVNCIHCTSSNVCIVCKTGYYGDKCNKACPEHCFDKTCNRRDGHCSYGCMDGFEEHDTLCKPVNASSEIYQPGKVTITTKADTVTIAVLATTIPLLICVVLGIIAYIIKMKFGHSTKSDANTGTTYDNIDEAGLPRTSGTNGIGTDAHINSMAETNNAYQSLEANRTDQSYASLVVNLTEGVVTVVPGKTDANMINNTDMVPANIYANQVEKRIYGNVNPDKTAAKCIPVIGNVEQGEESVQDKCYENMEQKGSGYMDMTFVTQNSVPNQVEQNGAKYQIKQNGAESNINDLYTYDNV